MEGQEQANFDPIVSGKVIWLYYVCIFKCHKKHKNAVI